MTMKPRFENWEILFEQWLRKAMQQTFVWGEFDCGLMAADCVVALTGYDPASDLRGTYSDGDGAVDALNRALGMVKYDGPEFGAFEAFCTERLGELCHPDDARKGDIVLGLFNSPHGVINSLMVDCDETYLVMAGNQRAIKMHKDGITAVSAWRVG
jgi:hypothetical protein